VKEAKRPPLDISASEVESIKALISSGHFLHAWELSKTIGPLDRWHGSAARTIAGRLANFLGASRLSSAIHILNHREHPGDPTAFLYHIFEHSSRFGALDGLTLLERFLGSHPVIEGKAQADLLAYRGQLLGYLRDFDEAYRSFNEAEALHPPGAWVHALRATVLSYEDRHEDALASAERGLALKPWHRASILASATALQNLHRDPEAITLLEEASAGSELATYAARLSVFHSDNDDFAKALACIDVFEQRSPLAEKSLRQWIAGRRSDFHYLSNQLDLAVEQASLANSQFHKAALPFMAAPDVQSKRRVRLPVSFVRQHDMTCAPATLTAMARFWGKEADQLDLAEQICYDGTPAHSERNWAEKSEFLVREFRLTAEVARHLADKGIPFCLATVEATSAHLQSVIGYDDRRGTLLIRDPTQRHYREAVMEDFIRDYAPTGPRAMLMIPPAKAALLDGINLPEAELYDLHHQIQRHLFAHQRELAIPLLEDMRVHFPGHRMTLTAEWGLAAYDCDGRARAASVKALLDLYPKCDHYRLARYRCLLELAPHSECLEFLQSILKTRKFDPVFLREYAALLVEDGRLRDQAKRYYERANRQRPRDEEVLTGLAGIEWSERRFDRALRLYRFASCAEVRSEPGAATYFRAALRLNRAGTVLPYLVRRFEDYRTRSSAPAWTLFNAHEALGRPSDGFSVLEAAIKSRPTDGTLLLFAARSHADYGQMEKAETRLQAAKPHASRISWARTAAHIAGIENRITDAIGHWKTVLAIDPLAMDAHRGLVGSLANAESVRTAIDHLREACAEFPHHSPLAQLFVEWLRYGKDPAAVPVLLQLIESDPNNIWARRELAIEYARQRRFEEAEEAARDALERNPSESWSHGILGSILMDRRCFEQAMPHLREAVRLDIDNEGAISSLLRCAQNNDERAEAVRFVTAELHRQTSNGDAFSAFRNAAYSLVPPSTLLGTLRTAHTARPDLWQSASVLIDQLLDMELFDEALAAAESLTADFPMLAAAWYDLSEVRQRRGEFAEQIQALDQALGIRPNWSSALRRKAGAQERLGQIDEAILSATQARTVAPLAPEAHGVLAKLLWQAGRRDEAIDALERATEISSGYTWGWETLAEWCHETGDIPRALAALDRLLAREAGEARAWLVAAKVHATLVNRESQLAAANRGLEIDPHHHELNDYKATALAELRRYPEALAACSPEAFAGKPPSHLRARAAWIKRITGKIDDAIVEFEAILADEPDYYWVTQQLCDLYEAKKDYEKSVLLGTQLIRLSPHNALAQGYKAHALIELDRWDEAAACLRRALQIDPDYAFAGNSLLKYLLEKQEFEAADEVIETFAPYRAPEDVLYRRLLLADAARDSERIEQNADAFLLTGPEGKRYAESVTEIVARTSRKARWRKKLAATILDGSQRNPGLGAVWMTQTLDRGIHSIWIQMWKLRRLKVSEDVSDEIWDVFLRFLSERGSARPLRWVIRANRHFLHSRESLWGSAGYALINAQCYRSVVEWHADWRSRSNVPAWMLFNLAVSIDGVEGLEAGYEIRRYIRANFPSDKDGDRIACCLGFMEAAHGDLDKARESFDEYAPADLTRYFRFIHYLGQAILAARSPQSDEAKTQAVLRFWSAALTENERWYEDRGAIAYQRRMRELVAPELQGRHRRKFLSATRRSVHQWLADPLVGKHLVSIGLPVLFASIYIYFKYLAP
jgi:tetratricopeptide (TPR) repeat protein